MAGDKRLHIKADIAHYIKLSLADKRRICHSSLTNSTMVVYFLKSMVPKEFTENNSDVDQKREFVPCYYTYTYSIKPSRP